MADIVVDTESKNSKELIGQGIRAYILQDYNAAVTALSKASELLVKELGDDLHDSLAEVYLYYGKALLSLSREEAEALGDVVPKNTQEDDEEDEDEGVENPGENKTAEEKDDTNVNGESSSATQKTENGTESANKTSLSENNQETKSGENTEESAENEEPTTENDEPTAENEEPTDLELAWEVLELAKKIYQRHGPAGRKNYAETLIVLGEISLENDNFEAAITDIKEGLQIQKELFGKDNRTVAESLYKLGIACSANSQIDEAIQSFNESIEYLKNRISYLETLEDNKDESEDEIKEIKNLLPDIEEKITDMKTYKDETLKKIISSVTSTNLSDGSSSSGSSITKPATDISHLVKRKRKQDEVVEEQEDSGSNPPKKPAV